MEKGSLFNAFVGKAVKVKMTIIITHVTYVGAALLPCSQ
jgi:hypothetical protein